MASPQVENGYTRLANELLEAMIKTVFSPNETRVLLYTVRMTYGYNKKTARISGQQWEEATGIKRTHIYRTLRKLQERNVVTMVGHKGSRKVGIQKNYTKWKTVTGRGLSDQVRSQLVTDPCHSLPIISKDNLKKAPYISPLGEFENILLTQDQLEKLQARFIDYQDKIENLSTYLATNDKKYKNHYAAILSWDRMDKKKRRFI